METVALGKPSLSFTSSAGVGRPGENFRSDLKDPLGLLEFGVEIECFGENSCVLL
jgi:hypothetical protein